MTRWAMLGVLAVAACGDDDGSGHLADAPVSGDAPVIDAMIDAMVPPPGVTVTVTLGGQASPNQVVYFQHADSTGTQTVTTDTYGDAQAVVPADSFVTVVEPPGRSDLGSFVRLTTFAGVQPGDHLYVNVPFPGQAVESTVDVTVPNEGLGYSYRLFTTCGQGDIGIGNGELRGKRAPLAAVSNTITVADCGGAADMLAVGTDSDGFVRSWAYKPDVAIAATTTVEFTEWSAPVDRTFSFTLVEGNAIDFEERLYTARGPLYSHFATVSDGEGGATRTVPLPNPAGVRALVISNDFPNGYGRNGVLDWGAIGDYTLDYNAVAFHSFASTPNVDVATHALTWDEAAGGKDPEIMFGSYQNSRSDGEVNHTWTWRILAPYTAGKLAYPVLPTTLLDFNPHVEDPINGATIRAVQVPGGFRAARTSKIFTTDDEADVGRAVAGTSGRIVLETVQFLAARGPAAQPAPARKPAALRRAGARKLR